MKTEAEQKTPVVMDDDIVITEKDFVLAPRDLKSHEQRFETKPTTFFKDSMRRFAKNKSSVAAAFILGVLILSSFIIPIADRNDIDSPHPDMIYLEPKLFPTGTGFWDGARLYSNIGYDTKRELPNVESCPAPWAILDGTLQVSPEPEFIYDDKPYAWGGLVQFAYDPPKIISSSDGASSDPAASDTPVPEKASKKIYMETVKMKFDPAKKSTDTISIVLTHHTEEDLKETDPILKAHVYDEAETYRVYCRWTYEMTGMETVTYLTEDLKVEDGGIEKFDLRTSFSKAVEASGLIMTKAKKMLSFGLEMGNPDPDRQKAILIESITMETDSPDEKFKAAFEAPSFSDANEMVGRVKKMNGRLNPAYWTSTGHINLFKGLYKLCSYRLDTYEATFGLRKDFLIGNSDLLNYRNNGWCDYEEGDMSSFKPTSDKCPVVKLNEKIEHSAPGLDEPIIQYKADIIYYKYRGLDKMPVYLFGTDENGYDMLKYVFEGLRTSLLLGFLTFVVCFLFGLVWGSISGYFGGNIDLAMERFTDILSGMPWIVLMTLMILHFGSNFLTFALSLCLTGWIGTASLTRTQFYRFKGREYVLASRSLGSSDIRLIFKHILPNAMGTIITSAVLMIPSVIFSEATISYLGLGLQNISSFGVILSANQNKLQTSPHLIIFPSFVMALIMISFNLFGNGLRDAINPSLKGEDEQ